jgi:hypothetical protein
MPMSAKKVNPYPRQGYPQGAVILSKFRILLVAST